MARYQVQLIDGTHEDGTPHVTDSCGHRHKTEETALKCLHSMRPGSDESGAEIMDHWYGASVQKIA
jgi:hypothetical protein